jgi:NadR type nicotinamide-nucleotide adenylyltransferase
MKKVVIIGPECTGKSSLTKALGQHYNTAIVEECAREYIDHLERSYTQDDILNIAKKQITLENTAKPQGDYLFCDTDLIVCKVWSEFKYGNCHPWILEQIQNRYYDYYLLCDIDLPWQEDQQREHPNHRQELFDIYEGELNKLNKPYSIIRGQNRLESAIEILDYLNK